MTAERLLAASSGRVNIRRRDDAPTRLVLRERCSVERSGALAMRQGADGFPRGNPGEAKCERVNFTGLEHRPRRVVTLPVTSESSRLPVNREPSPRFRLPLLFILERQPAKDPGRGANADAPSPACGASPRRSATPFTAGSANSRPASFEDARDGAIPSPAAIQVS